ncbi:hypothetical protein GCM10009718_27260 [Isoptericola halotolerans]
MVARLRSMSSQRRDSLRAGLYSGVFRPAGRHLPMPVVRALAWPCAALLVAAEGWRSTGWHRYRDALGCSTARALGVFWAQQAGLLEEHAFQHGARAGRLRPDDYDIRIVATPEARQVLDGNEPFVVVSGHFLRDAALFAMFAPTVSHRSSSLITVEPPAEATTAQERRVQRQLSASLEALERWSAPADFELIYLGNAARHALQALSAEKRFVWINIDAPWTAGRGPTVEMPFAGHASRTFSTGSARIARSARCPLLLALPEPPRGRTVTLRVLGPYTSTSPDPRVRDAEVTRAVLADVERHIGRRPEHYLLDIGSDRRWDRATSRWIAG